MTILPVLAVLFFQFTVAADSPRPDFIVSPAGNDSWSGRLAEPNRDKTDGPFATVDRARNAVRELKPRPDVPRTVAIRGGTYYLKETVAFGPDDSGTKDSPIVYISWDGEIPVLSGGIRVTGWKKSGDRWMAKVPGTARSGFTQLWANGVRRYRSRLPREGYYHIAKGVSLSGFRCLPDEFPKKLANPDEVEVLVFQNWTMNRTPLAGLDAKTLTVTLAAPVSEMADWAVLKQGARFIFDNVREALAPGQWHLDAKAGTLTYLPLPGETPENTEVIVPRLSLLVEFNGDVKERKWVAHLELRGISFAHTGWTTPPRGQNCGQAEVNLDGALTATGARNITIADCAVAHTSCHGMDFGAGCRDIVVERCAVTDLGAGAVKAGTTESPTNPEEAVERITVRDCTLAHGGRFHPAGIGVLILRAAGCQVVHNDIFDFYYTGVSVGWSWGYADAGTRENRVADNHIYNLGQGVLNDMGGIYTLSPQPGTVLVGNKIHDIECADGGYGGWGIYYDEGSTGIVAEGNLVYRTNSAGFHQHYGRENFVRNNIFAFGGQGQLMRTRAENHLSFTLERNIVLADGVPLLASNWSGTGFEIVRNLYWDLAGAPTGPTKETTWEQWKAQGHDANSVVADPGFADPRKGDFTLKPDSPAFRLGIKPPDVSKAGRITKPELAAEPKGPWQSARDYPVPPLPITEDYENVAVGEKTPDANTFEDNDQGTARITAETAALGQHSVKFAKPPKVVHAYNPHMHFSPGYSSGTWTGKFAVRMEKGGRLGHEWRDWSVNPYKTGPVLFIDGEGTLTANGKKIAELPHGKWVAIEIKCGIGPEATPTYDLIVTLPGRKPAKYPELPCNSPLKKLTWWGWTADGTAAGDCFYLDDISLTSAH
jgi:hypothetical protein